MSVSKNPISTQRSAGQEAMPSAKKVWKKFFEPADVDVARRRLDELVGDERVTREQVLALLQPYILKALVQRQCTLDQIRDELRALGIRVSRAQLLKIYTEASEQGRSAANVDPTTAAHAVNVSVDKHSVTDTHRAPQPGSDENSADESGPVSEAAIEGANAVPGALVDDAASIHDGHGHGDGDGDRADDVGASVGVDVLADASAGDDAEPKWEHAQASDHEHGQAPANTQEAIAQSAEGTLDRGAAQANSHILIESPATWTPTSGNSATPEPPGFDGVEPVPWKPL